MDPIEITIFQRAVEYSKSGQNELANKDLRLLLEKYPTSIQVLVWTARTEKHTKLAVELLTRARERDPDNPMIQKAWDELQGRLAANTPQASEKNRVINKMIFDRAVALAVEGYTAAANADFRKLLDINVNDVEVLIWTSRTEENITNAKYFLEFAGLVDPKHPSLKQAWKEFKRRERAAK